MQILKLVQKSETQPKFSTSFDLILYCILQIMIIRRKCPETFGSYVVAFPWSCGVCGKDQEVITMWPQQDEEVSVISPQTRVVVWNHY